MVVAPGAGGHRVVAVNGLAREKGAETGMLQRQAEALCPTAVVLEQDRSRDALTFEVVVAAVELVVPRVEVVEPGLLFVPIAGAVRYYGGERPIVELVEKELTKVAGVGGRLGIASGPFAARWAAAAADPTLIIEDDAAFLSTLDVATLGQEELVATFRWLGVTTLGALAELPREVVASRFGPVGITAYRLASGEDRLVIPRDHLEDLTVERRYEDPLETLDQVGFAARALANLLISGLVRHGVAPHRIEVEAEASDETIRTRVWSSADPFTEATLAERIWWQLRAWIESDGIGGGVVRLRLTPADLSDEGRQLALLEDTTARIEAERAFARTQAMLGPDSVMVARPQGGRTPADRVAWTRWGDPETPPSRDPSAPWPGAAPSPSPSLVPPVPTLLEVEWDEGTPSRVRLGSRWEPVLSWSGPWRLTGRWWRGEAPADRYQIVTSAGAVLCELAEGRAYLTGIYD